MDGTTALIFGVLVPAVVAGAVLLFWARGKGEERPARTFIGALAFGIGYLVAYRFIYGLPNMPGANVQLTPHEWLAWFVLGAILLAPVRDVASLARWSNPLYVALFAVLTFRFPLANVLASDFAGLAIRFGLTLVMYMAWNASDKLAERLRGPALPTAWMVAGTGIALSALFARTALMAQLAGALTACLGAAAVVGWIDRGARFPSGAVAIAWIVFAGVLVTAGIYDLEKTAIALLVVALLAPWLATRKTLERRPLAQTLLACAAAAVPTAIALWIAYRPDPA